MGRIKDEAFFQMVHDYLKIYLPSQMFASSNTVSGCLNWLVAEKGRSSSTRNQRFACIRSFFRYAAASSPENIVLLAGLDRIPRQKQKKFSGVDYMSEATAKALLEQPDTKTRRGVREQFFMILMYESAARIQEMLDLRVYDISPGNSFLNVLLSCN